MTDFQTAYARHTHYFLEKIARAGQVCRTCGFADCPGASGGDCPRWPARDEQCYCTGGAGPHPYHGTPRAEEPERFGPGYVTDLCRCGHERGEHWDGEGMCDPAMCGCRTFRPQQVD